LVSGEHRRPPAYAYTHITDGEEGGDDDEKEQNNGPGPAHAQLKGVATEHAGLADVRRKLRPRQVIVNHVA
jgi:hypothetical protein